MRALREENLIKKGLLYFILPWFTLGILALFFPFMYVLIPAHESDLCICSFYQRLEDDDGDDWFWFFDSPSQFEELYIINVLVFYMVNWLFLMALVTMLYFIRHINDETMIKRECAFIVATWVLFSTCQYVVYTYSQVALCYSNVNDTISAQFTYILILGRDITTLIITSYYSIKVNSN